MLGGAHVDVRGLREAFDAIRPGLVRYPSVDADALAARVTRFLDDHHP